MASEGARKEFIEPALETVELPDLSTRQNVELVRGPLADVVAEAAELATKGRAAQAFRLLERELAHEGGHAPIGVRASLLVEASLILWMLGRFEESEARARRGIALAELAGDPELAADALVRLGLALHRSGRLEGAREAYEEAGARFRRLGNARKAGAAANNLGLVCKDRGEWESARTHLESAVAAARHHASPRVLGARLKNLGLLELKAGLWKRAESSLTEARGLFTEAKDTRGTTLNSIALGMLERLRRHLPAAYELGQRALAQALSDRLSREEALACELLGDVALDQGDLRAARMHYDRALRIADRVGPAPDLQVELLRRLATLALRQGDPALACRHLDRARPIAAKLGNPYESAMLEVTEADRALAAGQPEAAQARLEEVAALLGELGERFERGRVLARLARLSGTAEEAVRLAFRAGACFAEAGAECELNEIGEEITRRIAVAKVLPPPDPEPSHAAPPARSAMPSLVGPSRAIARVRVRISRVARHPFPVLLRGEKGTGKDLVATLLHGRSRAKDGPLVAVHCRDIDEDRVLAHLFGSSGPRERVTIGAIERADGGTLYLDGMDSLPWPAQSGILRVLERGSFCRVGDLEPREVSVRIVASVDPTHDAGPLRAELMARFARGTIDIPPLRARRDDIVPIARAFLAGCGLVPPPRLAAEAASLLIEQPWFGNVRELHECMGQVLAEIGPETALIGPDMIAPLLEDMARAAHPGPETRPEESTALRARLKELERQNILRSLSRAHGNKTTAARDLRIARKTLYEKMKRLGIALD